MSSTNRLAAYKPAAKIAVELALIVALAPVMLTARGFAWAPLLALALVLPARVAVENDLLPRPILLPLGLWLLTLVMALALGAQISTDAAWARFWAYCYGIVVMTALYNLAQHPRARAWLGPAWLAVVVALSVGGLVIMSSNVANKIPLLTSVFARIAGESVNIQNSFRNEEGLNPNVLAGTMLPAILMPLAYGAWLWRAEKLSPSVARWRRPLLIVLAVAGGFMAFTLVLTQSRGGLLGFFAGAFAMLAFRNRRAALVALAVIAAMFVLGLLVLPLADINARNYANGRLELWVRAIALMRAFPLTGVGLNMFGPASELLYPELLAGQPSLIHAHNMWLQLALDFGLFGLAFAVWTVILIWLNGLRGLRAFVAQRDRYMLWTMRGLLAGQVALFVFNLTDFANLGSKQSFVFWAAWGLILGLAVVARRASSPVESAAEHDVPTQALPAQP